MIVMLAIACGDRAVQPESDARSPCAALCERLASCGPPADFEGVAGCTRTCDEDPRQREGPCREPRIAYERCIAAAPCEDVRAVVDPEAAKARRCAAETRAVIACEPDAPATPFIYFQF